MSDVPESRRRSAFTLVELLVVIAIIGTLVGLLLPAVQTARESGRRSVCINNSKQIALGVSNYESVNKGFPRGIVGGTIADSAIIAGAGFSGYGTHVLLLPYVEEQILYDKMRVDSTPSSGTYSGVPWRLASTDATLVSIYQGKRVNSYVCPSAGVYGDSSTLANCTYPLSTGPNLSWTQLNTRPIASSSDVGTDSALNGAIRLRKMNPLREFTDGLSKTILVGEQLLGPGTLGSEGPASAFNAKTCIGLGISWSGNQTTFDGPITQSQIDSYLDASATAGAAGTYTGTMGALWWRPVNHCTLINTVCPPNDRRPSGLINGSTTDYGNSRGVYVSRSNHPGGVVHAFADGSVTFIADSIAIDVYQGLGSRNGGETVAAP